MSTMVDPIKSENMINPLGETRTLRGSKSYSGQFFPWNRHPVLEAQTDI